MRWSAVVLLWLASAIALAQEGMLHADPGARVNALRVPATSSTSL